MERSADHCLHQRPCLSRRGLSGDRQALPRHPSGLHRTDRDGLRTARDPVRDRRPCAAQAGRAASAASPLHSNAARYGFGQQSLDCDFCMAVRAGEQVILRGQTGTTQRGHARRRRRGGAGRSGDGQRSACCWARPVRALADVVKATCWSPTALSSRRDGCRAARLNSVTPCFSALVVRGWPARNC